MQLKLKLKLGGSGRDDACLGATTRAWARARRHVSGLAFGNGGGLAAVTYLAAVVQRISRLAALSLSLSLPPLPTTVTVAPNPAPTPNPTHPTTHPTTHRGSAERDGAPVGEACVGEGLREPSESR